MKLSLAIAAVFVARSTANAFITPATNMPVAFQSRESTAQDMSKGIADELGTPCEDECAMDHYPNLPKSVHPGVVTGQAMIDLLNHAKENGKNSHSIWETAFFIVLNFSE